MLVSVVVCSHTTDRFEYLSQTVQSLLAQTHEELEVVLVSDGDPELTKLLKHHYSQYEEVTIHELPQNRGLLKARNAGAEVASGDIVAFIDDDAVAAEDWVQQLHEAYERHDVPAVGGRMLPRWVADRPRYLPEEFYWLIGVTHRGFPQTEGEVRNTNGSNISFKRDVFLELGGFESDIGGRTGDANLQGGETELCARMRQEYGQGVWYVPEAEVEHMIFEYRTDVSWLLDRAFWQGYSKRGMEKFVPESTGEEQAFLKQLLIDFLPSRIRGLVREPTLRGAEQLMMVFVFTATVGAGYLYGVLKWR